MATFPIFRRNLVPTLLIGGIALWAATASLISEAWAGEGDPALAQTSDLWSLKSPSQHQAPTLKGGSWVRRHHDHFILQQIEKAGLTPAKPADRRTLIRRASFDITGLPPSPEQVNAFLGDSSPESYSRVVEDLLASPHFGEHWARLWLDVARYGEDQAHIVGNNRALCYPNAYRYRDWVIQAFNRDLPYDDFIRLQLAADLIEPGTPDSKVALGFIGLGPKYYRRGDAKVMADEWEDRVDTLTRGLMGITVACARCHDHKYDPIPTSDYYALAGVFASTVMFNEAVTDEAELNNDGQAKNPELAIHIIREAKDPRDLKIQIRGDASQLGAQVDRGFLSALCGDEPVTFTKSNSGRRDLAEAIVSDKNPLTARVFVNRVWKQLHGQAIVATPSNFGVMGGQPTHPELLDDLSVRFMENGWSLKWLVKECLLSATYQQSSQPSEQQQKADPENKLYSHMNRRRLQVEQWRDALLSCTDQLDRQIGGPSIDPAAPENTRRTVYSEASRLKLNEVLARFDYPDPNAHSPSRDETTTPLQKLFILNHPLMVCQAEALANHVTSNAETEEDRIHVAYERLYGRGPTLREIDLGLAFLEADPGTDEDSPWEQYAHVLLASNEFYFLD